MSHLALGQRHFQDTRGRGREESKSIRFFNGWLYKEEYFPEIAQVALPATMLGKAANELRNKSHEKKLLYLSVNIKGGQWDKDR